jgi:hypothetical protein
MNSYTGELRSQVGLDELQPEQLLDFQPIPNELRHAAEVKLAGRDKAMVSLTSGGKLSKFAAKNRKDKRMMQRQSRRKNR